MLLLIIIAIVFLGACIYLWKGIDANRSSISEMEAMKSRAAQLQEKIDQLEAQSRTQHEQIESDEQLIARESEQTTISIRYAEGIQRSLIPSEQKIRNIFEESFVYFEPKDIVSGDFYNIFQLENFTMIIVADCTGHGVPGGFLSMLGMAGLRDLLPKYYSHTHMPTGEILDKMRDFVTSSLASTIEGGDDTMEVSDGMDMTMAAISADRRMMTFSLADHNIYLGRDGEMEKLKGDRMPIGRHPNQDKHFEEKSLVLKPGDMLYFCSDGIQDQIGGPDDCKYLTKRLSKLLKENAWKEIPEQKKCISKEVDDWKRGYDQVDDQTLIGIRIH
ncbi:MAG: SpoIIE family protein phosphatase [Bacteroidales bacterium]|nr:SpoIIE family protein phosphatase [Bacteroidales bacterium]